MMLCVRLKTRQIALCELSSDPELAQIPNGLCDFALSDRGHIYGAHQLFTESESIQWLMLQPGAIGTPPTKCWPSDTTVHEMLSLDRCDGAGRGVRRFD
ncbi:hypothetical protein L6452_42638 [Arctium lappa]|uniref:Uncharacterized protein n=1 Tax=Arctium lappa TaxID=4217 RepID=A0ACB8XJ06_ARCLA|nr:hypothetical protein L6452_42638 [Arctium lappa]